MEKRYRQSYGVNQSADVFFFSGPSRAAKFNCSLYLPPGESERERVASFINSLSQDVLKWQDGATKAKLEKRQLSPLMLDFINACPVREDYRLLHVGVYVTKPCPSLDPQKGGNIELKFVPVGAVVGPLGYTDFMLYINLHFEFEHEKNFHNLDELAASPRLNYFFHEWADRYFLWKDLDSDKLIALGEEYNCPFGLVEPPAKVKSASFTNGASVWQSPPTWARKLKKMRQEKTRQEKTGRWERGTALPFRSKKQATPETPETPSGPESKWRRWSR